MIPPGSDEASGGTTGGPTPAVTEAALPRGGYGHSHSVRTAGNLILAEVREYGGYRVGYATTPHGIVGVYDERRAPATSLDFIVNGRFHRMTWPRRFSDRYLLTLAKRYAANLSATQSQGTARAMGPASSSRSGVLPREEPPQSPINKPTGGE